VKKQLVILTTHFGANFSGGSLATCEIFTRLEKEFSKITVLGTKIGDHSFEQIEFVKYTSWLDAVRSLRKFETSDTVFYGDFYNSFLFVLARKQFFFTYHDNWPEASKISFKHYIDGLFYNFAYRLIFIKARIVFSVSDYKVAYIKKFTDRVFVVRNGFKRISNNLQKEYVKQNVLMVGSVDQRKYKLAVELFSQLEDDNINIHIYGNIIDSKIERKLSQFKFVSYMGFNESIPYYKYKILLHTSIIENLPIVFCEAIYHAVPILAFNVGGSPEIVASENGELVPCYDIYAMKARLLDMMSKPMIINRNNTNLGLYDWTKASKNYLSYING
jgi:glycosyltransferase involved in cell wall biosynthesis